ncbi:glycosyltransferase family 2 protein [Gryllotalpicola ginsengisoli]|uniref:glycosyltransferase family 2 protein n=1 Tax=Gryllotalpicola ginsengisoli TaxID=444608 RepID=UPI0003B2EE16|nr:cellulose synthase catalytic subunit [Gryllotalpicola ginsengisoli]
MARPLDGPGPTRPARPLSHSPLTVLLVLLCTAGVLAYAGFLLNPAHRGNIVPYAMVISAESVLVFHALVSMWTILSAVPDPRGFAFYRAQAVMFIRPKLTDEQRREHRLGLGAECPEQWPVQLAGRVVDIDLFVTVYGEDLETVRRTVTAAIAVHGKHRTWVLDDGHSDEVKQLAEELGARYVRRLSRNGAKAGNVNHALSIAKGDYFAIFDADFAPAPTFLYETLPFFAEPDIAFVQTPQTYGNLTTTISTGAAYMQSMFYRYVQPGRNRFNAAFCVGTNVVFRRSAIDEVGGMYTDSKSEDVWTSLMLHEAGWRSMYIPTVLAIGDAPETIEAYSKQQLRWATGGFEILFTHNPFSPRRRLTMDQRLQYFVTATFYLTGIAPLLLILVPPLEIYFDLRPMNLSITPLQWVLYYGGFYGLQIVLALFTQGTFKWQTLTLATVSFPIYTKALLNVLTGTDQAWQSTGTAKQRSPFEFIAPQVMFFVFLALTSFVAITRDVDNGGLTLATAWNITNTLILGAFLVAATREAHRIRHPLAAHAAAVPTRAPAQAAPLNRPITVVARPEHAEGAMS